MWSRRFSQCVLCSTTAYRHMAKGLCSSCYAKQYKSDPEIKARVYAQRDAWHQANYEDCLLKSKLSREQRHFAGQRETVLERDGHACTKCGETALLVVHHRDGEGRGKEQPNNELSNLITLCRSCHIEAHRRELEEARRRNGFHRPKCGPYKRKHKT